MLAWCNSLLIWAVASSTVRKSTGDVDALRKWPEELDIKLAGRKGGEVGVGSCAIEPRDDRSSLKDTSSFMRIKMS